MTPFDLLASGDDRQTQPFRISGVVVGIVTNNKDPDGLARVKLRFPWLSSNDESNWARVVSVMAGSGRGFYALPEVNDEVLVVFEHGDMRFPYVLGGLWNGKDKPPESNGDGKNNVRMLKSRSGHIVRLSDEESKGKIEIIDRSGKNSLVFDTASNTITITAGQEIKLSAAQGTITLEARKIELKASGEASIESGAAMEVKAQASMTIKGAVVNIN
jgi:uncharacterized protein involved in type VI secretion and phage assembly